MFTLRPQQKKDIGEITAKFKEHKEIGYSSPTDSGKTTTAVKVSLNLGTPVTYFTSTYEGVKEVIKTLSNLGVKDKLTIVLPRGKDKVAREVCKCTLKDCRICAKEKSIDNLGLNKKDFVGKITTPESINIEYSDYCPYCFLIELCKGNIPDYTITHWKAFSAGRLRTHGNVVLDEIDESLKRTDLLWAKYDISAHGWHLETSSEVLPLRKAVKILDLLKDERNPYDVGSDDHELMMYFWLEPLRRWIVHMITEIEQNPISYEIESLKNRSKDGQIPEDELGFGLMLAYTKIREKIKKFWEPYIKSGMFTATLDTVLENWHDDYVRKLPEYEDRDLIRKLMYVFKNVEGTYFKRVSFSPVQRKGYIEVWLITARSKIQKKLEDAGYNKILYVSATFPSNIKVPVVANKKDLNGDKKLVVFVGSKIILNKVLREIHLIYNILGVTTSYWRAEKAEKEFQGGLIRKHDNFKELLDKKLKRSKGRICWTYFGSKFSRATNDLSVFDGAVFKDFLDKTDHLSFGDEEDYKGNCAGKLYQTVSRIFRTVDNYHRRRFLVTNNEDGFERLKRMAPDWIYKRVKTTKDAVKLIKKHAEPFKSIPWKKSIKLKFTERVVKGKEYVYLQGYVPDDYKFDLNKEFIEISKWDLDSVLKSKK